MRRQTLNKRPDCCRLSHSQSVLEKGRKKLRAREGVVFSGILNCAVNSLVSLGMTKKKKISNHLSFCIYPFVDPVHPPIHSSIPQSSPSFSDTNTKPFLSLYIYFSFPLPALVSRDVYFSSVFCLRDINIDV